MAIRITRGGVGLAIGILVLGLVLVGGLYVAKERGEQARREEAIQIAEQNLESESNGSGVTDPERDSSNGTANGDDSTSNEDDKNAPVSGSEEDDSDEMATTGVTDELPQTGPTEAVAVLAIALLAFTGVSYFNSYRTLLKLR